MSCVNICRVIDRNSFCHCFQNSTLLSSMPAFCFPSFSLRRTASTSVEKYILKDETNYSTRASYQQRSLSVSTVLHSATGSNRPHNFTKPPANRLFATAVKVRSDSCGSPEQERLVSAYTIRHLNENSFLSWCRNAYLSTVVGAAMITGGGSTLSQAAGMGALLVGSMNLYWGTGCHIVNLIRLNHATDMSGFTLFLHLSGSALHCLIWSFVLLCFIGFLDESDFASPSDQDNLSPVRVSLDNAGSSREKATTIKIR